MTHRCRLAHSCANRTRLRWLGDRQERSAILDLADAIAELEGVSRVQPRLSTGSIIIEHPEAAWSNLASQLQQQLDVEFVTPAPAPARPGLAVLSSGLDEINSALKDSSDNGLDLRTLAFLLLVGLAIAQATRGQVMVSAASLLWYAMRVTTLKPMELSPDDGTDNGG